MNGFIDIHQHFLYGLDDGARTVGDMTAMLARAYDDGIRVIIATPHAEPGMKPFNREKAAARLDEARAWCAANAPGLRLTASAELLYTPAMMNVLRDHTLPTLGKDRHVLVEFVPDISYSEMEKALDALSENGYRVVIAHVERYRCLLWSRGRTRALKERFHAQLQVNCGTFLRKKGLATDRAVAFWLRERLIDYAATDAHGVSSRGSHMREAHDWLKRHTDEDHANMLTGGNARRFLLDGGSGS